MTPSALNTSGIQIEAGLVLLLFILLILDMVKGREEGRMLGGISLAGLLALSGYAFLLREGNGPSWHGMVVLDGVALWFKRFFLLTAALVVVMARRNEEMIGRGLGAFYALIVVATLGMCLMASAHHFVLLFIALELVTVSFYVLVSYARPTVEAGLKYLIVGTVSASIFLMGISFVYGGTGSLDFSGVGLAVALSPGMALPLAAGVLLLFLGLGFKVASVPFHSWAPDVYQGAQTPVVAFLSVGSKAAGFVVLMRFAFSIFPGADAWWVLIAVITPLTLFYGNLGAIWQGDIKRLLGYSSIGQAGYLLLGIASRQVLGGAAMVYFLYVYLFSNLLAFLVVAITSAETGSTRIADLSGLSRRSPILAGSMLIALLSLAGVPPLGGFFGKFLLIGSVLQSGQVWLAVVGIVNVAVALYYYLIVVKMMYIRPAADAIPITVGRGMKALLYLLMAVVVLLGIFQEPLMEISREVSMALFGGEATSYPAF